MTKRRFPWILLFFFGGCGGGPNEDIPPGDFDAMQTSGIPYVDSDGYERRLGDLYLNERRWLCDWTAMRGGGYGLEKECKGGASDGMIVRNAKNQEDCLEQYLDNCNSVKVAEWEQCRNKEITDLCALFIYSAPECEKVEKCLLRNDGGPPPEPPEAAPKG